MTVQDSATLKSYFESGDRPTEGEFGDLIDSIDLLGGSVINVKNDTYGAVGDGVTDDRQAFIDMFAAASSGSTVVIPPGTYLFKGDGGGQDASVQVFDKSFNVFAYGATFKMDADTGYVLFSFETTAHTPTSQLDYVSWHGGTFDGDKDNQDWPGSTVVGGDDSWDLTRGNYGLLTIRDAKYGLIEDVVVKDSVANGAAFYDCELGFFQNCEASGGAPLNFGDIAATYGTGRQATYFAVTRGNSGVGIWNGIKCDGGSIAIHYTTSTAPTDSVAIADNIVITDPAQDALHFEHCEHVYVTNFRCTNNLARLEEPTKGGPANIHISNSTLRAYIANGHLESTFGTVESSAKVDFRNASNLIEGIVDNVTVITREAGSRGIENATRVSNSRVTNNDTGGGIIADRSIDNCQVAISGGSGVTMAPGVGDVSKCTNTDVTAVSGSEGTGIGFNIGGGDVFVSNGCSAKDLQSGFVVDPDHTIINTAHIEDMDRNAVDCSGMGAGSILRISDSYFEDFGLDTGAASDLRPAIGGNNGEAEELYVDNCHFVKIDANAHDRTVNNSGVNPSKLRYRNNDETAMTTAANKIVTTATDIQIVHDDVRDFVPLAAEPVIARQGSAAYSDGTNSTNGFGTGANNGGIGFYEFDGTNWHQCSN